MRFSDFARSVPRSLVRAWVELADKRVISADLRYVEDSPYFTVIEEDGVELSEETSGWFRWACAQSTEVAIAFYMAHRAIGYGPKIFKPTEEQAKMLLNTDLNLEFDDYDQPFPTTIVEIPPLFGAANRLSHTGRLDSVDFVILDHCKDRRLLLCDAFGGSRHHPLIWRPSKDETMEQFFDRSGNKLYPVFRMALNYCLLVDEYGSRRIGSEDPVRYSRLRERGRKPTNRHRESARVSMATIPTVYEIDRKPILCRVERAESAGGGESGRTISPHMRRGHYAMVACGEGRAERRRVRRPPVFVNGHLFLGTMDNAVTTYSDRRRDAAGDPE